jgi:hypothetical protein
MTRPPTKAALAIMLVQERFYLESQIAPLLGKIDVDSLDDGITHRGRSALAFLRAHTEPLYSLFACHMNLVLALFWLDLLLLLCDRLRWRRTNFRGSRFNGIGYQKVFLGTPPELFSNRRISAGSRPQQQKFGLLHVETGCRHHAPNTQFLQTRSG